MHAPNLFSTTHLGCHCPPTLIGTPPISWPCATTTTPPQSTLSRFFHSKPCQTGMHSKIFVFLCTGPTPTPPTLSPTWGDLHPYVHPCTLPGTHCPFPVDLH